MTVEPYSLLQGDFRAGERLRQTRDMIQAEVTRMESDVLGKPKGFNPSQIAKTRANVSELKALMRDYDVVLKSFRGDAKVQKRALSPAAVQRMKGMSDDDLLEALR